MLEGVIEALEHTRSLIKETLGHDGSEGREVRRCDLRNHSVKCFLDDPDDPHAFTVDVTPALVHPAKGFWIPEQDSRQWIRSDPEHLIGLVAAGMPSGDSSPSWSACSSAGTLTTGPT